MWYSINRSLNVPYIILRIKAFSFLAFLFSWFFFLTFPPSLYHLITWAPISDFTILMDIWMTERFFRLFDLRNLSIFFTFLLYQRDGYNVYALQVYSQFRILNPTFRPLSIWKCLKYYLWNYREKVEMRKREQKNSERYHDSDGVMCTKC